MADTLGTNTTGFGVPGDSTYRELVVTLNNKDLQFEATKKSCFSRFIGKKGDTSPFIMVNDFQGKEGDTCNIALIGKLSGAGIAGNGKLEDSEEAFKVYDQQVRLNTLRHAIKDDGQMSEQRTFIDTIETGKKQLGTWFNERFDYDMFNTVYYGWPDHIAGLKASGCYAQNSSAARPARYWYIANEANNGKNSELYSTTDATYVAAIQTAEAKLTNLESDYFSPALIEGMAAKHSVRNFAYLNIDGFRGSLCIAHAYQIKQLRTSEKWFTAMTQAMPRDEKGNPLFRGVNGANILGMWDNTIIMESNNVNSGAPTRNFSAGVITSGGSNGANVRRAVFLGSNAIALAMKANTPKLIPKEDFDYNFKKGCAIQTMWGAARGDFTSDDGNETVISQNLSVVSTYSPETTI